MTVGVKKMKPVEMVRFLNSTELGTVITASMVYRHFAEAGYRIASTEDSRCLSFYRYAAWLIDRRNTPPQTAGADPSAYEAHRESAAQRQADLSLAGRDIGELPAVVNPERKDACRFDLRKFCESYFPETYSLEWSNDHLRAIEKLQKAVLEGGLFALAMARGSGKALSLDTPLPTPGGWTTMGEVEPGGWLYDERGRPCRVVAKSPVFTGHDCYRVVFNDGAEVVCDADHLWTVEDLHKRRNPRTYTTRFIAENYRIGRRGWNECRFRIPYAKPIECMPVNLPIEPYALGVWLGDGTSESAAVTLFDGDAREIAANVRLSAGFERLDVRDGDGARHALPCTMTKREKGVVPVRDCFRVRLRSLGILGAKRIPDVYLRAPVEERLALLQGIMDTDGHCDRDGSIEICIKRPDFADGFGELLTSLGIRHTRTSKMVTLNGKKCGPYARFYVKAFRDQGVFRLKRKLDRMRVRPPRRMTEKGVFSHQPSDVRTIVAVEPVASVPTQCVVVDSPTHLYLAGRRMVPTHNSSLTETAAIWAMAYGHREFIVLIGASEGAALEMLDSVKTELEVNEHIAEDFPETVYPIAKLEGISNRCAGQLYKGERTRISWTASEIVLPTIPGAASSGAIVRVAGITGRIRGMKYKKPDGRTIRPELVIVDDPQTSESAGSAEQTRKRVRVLAGDILGLAGPGRKIAGVMPCTVIRPGDMAEQMLDRSQHPEWNGERCRMLYRFPKNEELWNKYADMRADELREKGTFLKATEFYRQHREEMDEGAVVSWPARFNHDEISAVQHAMNLKLTDEAAFWAEYQNEPLAEDLGTEEQLTVDGITARVNGHSRLGVPVSATHLTAFIDVQKTMLFYTVAAWDDDFTGRVIDYGEWPDQNRRFFSLNDANVTLQQKFPRSGLEGCLYEGLKRLTEEILGREYFRDDGAAMRIERCLIDANWGQSTDTVYQFCRETEYASIVTPSHGKYIGASSKPMSEYKRAVGDRVGMNWRMPNVRGKRAVRHVVYDTNFWKSFVATRLLTATGDRGALTLYGRSPADHLLFAEHLTAEYRVKTEGRGRRVDEWKMRPDAHDNHWWDCLVGSAVAASMSGCVLAGTMTDVQRKAAKPKMKLSELRRMRG